MDQYKGYKIKIYPTEIQKNIIAEYFGASRFVYNLGIDLENEEYEKTKGFLNKIDLDTKFTNIRKTPTYKWLQKFETSSMRFILHDVVNGFIMFFNNYNRKPKYKSKKDSNQSMAVRNDRIYIGENSITIPGGIGDIKCGSIPSKYIIGKANPNTKDPRPVRSYYRTRIIFDGVDYYFTFQMKINDENNFASVEKRIDSEYNEKNGVIGIDLGFGYKKNNWIVDSNGYRVSKPNSDKEWNKIRRLNRKYSRQLNQPRAKADPTYRSKNMIKTVRWINKYYNRITNKKKSAIYNYVSHQILDKNPETVVIEDLKIPDMICRDQHIPAKDRMHFNRLLYDASIGIISSIIEYTCTANGIKVIKVPSTYKSTQRCSNCGHEHHMGKNNIYRCDNCGLVIDRDYNSALNLKIYPSLI